MFHDAFYGNCSPEDEAFATPRLTPQPAAPLQTPVVTTEQRWGRIPRFFIECTGDRTITLRLRREVQKHSPCQQTFSIDTDYYQ